MLADLLLDAHVRRAALAPLKKGGDVVYCSVVFNILIIQLALYIVSTPTLGQWLCIPTSDCVVITSSHYVLLLVYPLPYWRQV